MPGFVGDQSNRSYLVGVINTLKQQVQALLTQQQAITTGVGWNLPTSDPHIAGQPWNNAGVVNISAG